MTSAALADGLTALRIETRKRADECYREGFSFSAMPTDLINRLDAYLARVERVAAEMANAPQWSQDITGEWSDRVTRWHAQLTEGKETR